MSRFYIYLHISVLKVFCFGLASGLSLLLSGNTLNFWLAKIGINTTTIGLFSLITLPYAFKYIFGIIVDRFSIPILSKMFDNTKSWIIFSQVLLITCLLLISRIDPLEHIIYTAILGFMIAVFAVIQDVILDAHRSKILNEDHKLSGAAIYILGYRIGMLISGAGAIYLSSFLSWGVVYNIMAIFALIIMVIIISTYKPIEIQHEEVQVGILSKKNIFYYLFKQPFSHLKKISDLFYILTFILLYRISDNIISSMGNIFLLDIGFNEIEIATSVKFFGIGASIFGGFISGVIVNDKNLKDALLKIGIIHSLSHLLFSLLAIIGHNISLLYIIMGIESFTAGMAMTAYIAYITDSCKGKFRATQYALLSSMIGVSRSIFPSFAGYIAELMYWHEFFIFVTILSIPGLIMAKYLPAKR